MDSNPPPAPANACATLSLCCAVTFCAAAEVEDTFCAWFCGSVEVGRELEGVGAATLSDMLGYWWYSRWKSWMEGKNQRNKQPVERNGANT